MKKSDINSESDIELLINTFYDQAKQNDRIGHYFTTTYSVNWETHLPIMYEFWASIAFQTGKYQGNPIAVHQVINQAHAFSSEDFAEWLQLFTHTVNSLFDGPTATLLLKRAVSIAQIMELKLLQKKSR